MLGPLNNNRNTIDHDVVVQEKGEKVVLADRLGLVHCGVEVLLKFQQLLLAIELVDGDVSGSISCSVLLDVLHGLLEHGGGLFQTYRRKVGQDVVVREMLLSFWFDGVRVFHLREHSSLRGILDPLSHKYLALFGVKIRALSLSHVVHPMTLEMVPAPFRQHAVSASLPHEPHPFIHVSVGEYHSSLPMGLVL